MPLLNPDPKIEVSKPENPQPEDSNHEARISVMPVHQHLLCSDDTISDFNQLTTASCPPYVIQMDDDGTQQTVTFNNILDYGDVKVIPEPPNLLTVTELLSKPFSFVSGRGKELSCNPFRRKSGILRVLEKQDHRSRIMTKNGTLRTEGFVVGKMDKYLKDIFNSILELNWCFIGIIFVTAFFLSWLIFAGLWFYISYEHGDLEPENLANSSFVPCVTNIKNFASAFLFSVETQHTIGYGGRFPTYECESALLLMSVQSIVGVIIQAWMAGIVFAKFTVPRHRGQTIVFSKNAVITMRNGALFLMCRITDLRKYSLLDAKVQMVIIKKETTEEGESIPFQQTELECGTHIDGTNPNLSLIWPVTISHKINESSPFYQLKPCDLLRSKFEIIVTLIGVTEETGNTIQVRTSYRPNEILWGHHFSNDVMKYDRSKELYVITHDKLNHTLTDQTPRKSAKHLDAKKLPGIICSTLGSRCISRKGSVIRLDLDKIKKM